MVAATTSTTTPVTSTTTTASSPSCGDSGAVAVDATGFESVVADFDVDGASDQLQTYFVPSDNRWRIRYLPGTGGSFDEEITDSGPVGAVRPVGGYDIDGDGSLEAFVVVGSGASAVLVGLYDVGDCTVTRVTLDGVAAAFPVGATVGNISGLTCQGLGHIDALFASAIGGGAYEGGSSPYDLAGSVLTQGFGDGAVWASFDEAATAVSGFDCPPLSL